MKNGFVIVRQVLDESDVSKVRNVLEDVILSKETTPRLLGLEDCLKIPEIYSVLFKEKVINALKAGLGEELAYIPDLSAHRNIFGIPGWHRDCGSESGSYLNDHNYKFAKCGIYLQSPDSGWGGSIYLVPKSHRIYQIKGNRLVHKFKTLCRSFSYKYQQKHPFTVPVKAGDMVFFDSRILHQAAPPNEQNMRSIIKHKYFRWEGIPSEHTKYVIYWDACNHAMLSDFLKNSQKRAIMEESYGEELSFCRYLQYFYPTDYPQDFVELASKNKVQIASLGKFKSNLFKRIYNEFSKPLS